MQNYKIIRTVNGGHAIVDPEDYDRLSEHRWFINSHGYAYRQGWDGIQNKGGKHWTIWMHREVNRTPDGLFTDHINCRKNDNRKANLRTATKAENGANRSKPINREPTSVYKGVSYHPSTRLWRARLSWRDRDGRKLQKTTYHKTEEQAALDHNRLAKEQFGAYAQLNELPEDITPTERRQKTSTYRGVGFHKKSGKWRASIDVDGGTKTIGAYPSEREAAIAYNQRAIAIRGDAAKLNTIQSI